MPRTNAEREAVLEAAQNKSILDVAKELGLNLEKTGQSYRWREHTSLIIMPRKNYFYWNSHDLGGGTIKLVETIKECNFKTALQFLTGVKAAAFQEETGKKRPFSYYLHDHKNCDYAKKYLINQRGLSESTVDFFIQKGILAQASWRHPDGSTEPVVVFKYKDDKNGRIIGASTTGIWKDLKRYPERGRQKMFVPGGDAYAGFHVDIGTPKTLIAFEAPIDMMSYYELFREKLTEVRLVAMDGKKKGTVSRYFSEMIGNKVEVEQATQVLETIEKTTTGLSDYKIILAVDNDEAGRHFVETFGITKVPVQQHLPKCLDGKEKMDWNDMLKAVKQPKKVTTFESKLNQYKSSPLLAQTQEFKRQGVKK